MNIPSYARYEYCNQKACEFLEHYNIATFPIDVEKIIHLNHWGLVRYSELMEKFKLTRNSVIRCLGSNDGYTIWDGSNYTISYNDDEYLGERTRFTLMHEIGHIYLNHLIDFGTTKIYRGSLTKSEYKVLENEANAFARNVLIPTAILQRLRVKNVPNIAQYFGVTYTAAKTRLNFYSADESLNKNQNLIQRLQKIVYKFYYKKFCATCGYYTVSSKIRFCPICGNQNLKRGEGYMIYPKLDSYENGKLKECPRCKNEETNIEGDYCQICGKPIINRCSDNYCTYDKALPTNARYCPICGNSSTFFNAGYLKEWNAKEETGGFLNIPDSDFENNLSPENVSEEFPFRLQ